MTRREIERLLPQFEGLIFKTAVQIIEGGVELELEDIRQLLRIKIWTAIASFDQSRTTRMDVYRFAFGCMRNMRKDIEKRPRRYNASIDEMRDYFPFAEGEDRGDRFDAHYLSIDAEQVYFEVEDEAVPLPSTLTEIERRIVELRLEGRLLTEIDRELKLSRTAREDILQSVRDKLADWKPSPRTERAPRPPLPQPERALVA